MQMKAILFLLAGLSLTTIGPAPLQARETDSLSHNRTGKEVKLGTAVVNSSIVKKVERSAYHVVSVNTEALKHSTKTLGDALSKAPGIKLRRTGGVGSDLQLMIDGFSGRHVKVFVDGIPQEGVGSAFSLNNIPAGYAERIEVYKGVIPVEFGTDALGGVINIVTGQRRRGWQLDASAAYGSHNTRQLNAFFSQSLANGFTYEVTAFQNYSDNNYKVEVPVEDFETGRIDRQKLEKAERFHDNYHNETAMAKVGWVGLPWADRIMLGVGYAHEYKEIQNGVRQEIVYGDKHRHGHSIMPTLTWRKRNLFVKGLAATLSVGYNRNQRTNVDTAQVKYNWRGEQKKLNSPGEQSYQHTRSDNDNWNGTLRIHYDLGKQHTFLANHVTNAFHRSNTSLLAREAQQDPIAKRTLKNITGLSYRWTPARQVNLSAFGKYYAIRAEGPIATDANASSFVKQDVTNSDWGYGFAGTWFLPLKGAQVKASYEKTVRLPTIEEMFGDEDLEQGSVAIRPERSHNVNVSLRYEGQWGKQHLEAEGGFIFRDTRDYIQRNIVDLSGGRQAASYVNYGKVLTKGFNIALRYRPAAWLSLGGHFTRMNVRDNMKTMMGTSVPNLLYKDRMPNLPYQFADADATLLWNDFWGKGNRLSLNYDMQYTHKFTYYASRIGANKGDFWVPAQWAHNLTLNCSLQNGRYHLALECHNFTNARLYDNFSLQKPGRTWMAKLSVHLGK